MNIPLSGRNSGPSPETGTNPPLVVDMDGTLLRTDMTFANVCWLAGHKPSALLGLPRWLMQGRNGFKASLADVSVPTAENLPLNEACVALIKNARAEGIRTVLASASDSRIVEAVARETGLFDEWFGSDRTANLKGRNKAAFLVERYGTKGFDYVGDSNADMSVWAVARKAYTVGAPPPMRRRAAAVNPVVEHLAPLTGRPTEWALPLLKAMRPHQWAKNVLIFVPLLAGHFVSLPNIAAALLAFAAFSLAASSAYLINDLLDLEADRAHPRKRTRPFASGAASIQLGAIAAPSLAVIALTVSVLFMPIQFVGALSAYYAATLSYSLWLKKKVFVDIFALAALYTLRIMAGAAAIGTDVSPWLLAFSMFFFLSLAVVKRLVELQGVIKSHGARTTKRDYWAEDLGMIQAFGAASGYMSVLVLALYFNSPEATALYRSPHFLWGICPLLLFWISRMLMLSNRGHLHDDPIVHTARDPVSFIIGLAIAGVIAASLLF